MTAGRPGALAPRDEHRCPRKGGGVFPPARCPPRTQVSRLSHSSTRSTDSTLNIFLGWPQRLPSTNQKPRPLGSGFESEGGQAADRASGGPSLPSGRSRGADAGNRSALSPAPPSLARGRALPCAHPAPPAHALLRERRVARVPRPEGYCARSRSLSPAPRGALPAPVHGPQARAPAGPCGGGPSVCVSLSPVRSPSPGLRTARAPTPALLA